MINLGASAAHKTILGEKGGLELLLQAVRAHPDNADVQEQVSDWICDVGDFFL